LVFDPLQLRSGLGEQVLDAGALLAQSKRTRG